MCLRNVACWLTFQQPQNVSPSCRLTETARLLKNVKSVFSRRSNAVSRVNIEVELSRKLLSLKMLLTQKKSTFEVSEKKNFIYTKTKLFNKCLNFNYTICFWEISQHELVYSHSYLGVHRSFEFNSIFFHKFLQV